MDYYSNLAEMYVGDDVSPDFYGEWVAHFGTSLLGIGSSHQAQQDTLGTHGPPDCLCCAHSGWVFPKYDHVAVGTGTVVNKTSIKQYQQVCNLS